MKDKSIARRPKHIRSYENADADGNRGEWMDFYICPVCWADLTNRDYALGQCLCCGQKLDLDGEDRW